MHNARCLLDGTFGLMDAVLQTLDRATLNEISAAPDTAASGGHTEEPLSLDTLTLPPHVKEVSLLAHQPFDFELGGVLTTIIDSLCFPSL